MIEHLLAAAQEQGFPLKTTQAQRLSQFFDLLTHANETTNLTRITDQKEAAYIHFMDSLSPLWLTDIVKIGASILDVGTGAGFPGIPLLILRPDVRMTLMDTVQKKVRFLLAAAEQLDLQVQVLHARAEELAHDPAHRERYDLALSRAVAPLPTLLELTLPFVKTGRHVLAWKGPGAPQEIAQAAGAMKVLGTRGATTYHYQLMSCQYDRTLISFQKDRQISTKYPRKPGEPKRNPL